MYKKNAVAHINSPEFVPVAARSKGVNFEYAYAGVSAAPVAELTNWPGMEHRYLSSAAKGTALLQRDSATRYPQPHTYP